MTAIKREVHHYVLWFLLTLWFYFMWQGRLMDANPPRGWIEVHVLLAVALVAGIAIRLYRTFAPQQAAEKAGKLTQFAVVFMILTAQVAPASLFVLVVGPRWVYRLWGEEGILGMFVVVVVLWIASASPALGAIGWMLFTGALLLPRSDQEAVPSRRQQVWRVASVFLWLALSSYFLQGQFRNTLPECVSSDVCTKYPYMFLQERCVATCTLSRMLEQEWLICVAVMVFFYTAVRAAGLVTHAIVRVIKPHPQSSQ